MAICTCTAMQYIQVAHSFLLEAESVPCQGAVTDMNTCGQAGKADVLVATDVASKGLDFPDIQHVINFDMPSEIENYVHRIGRTGRCGKTGIATSFINKNQSESILLDLKHLLKEAKQRIPPVLMVRHEPPAPHFSQATVSLLMWSPEAGVSWGPSGALTLPEKARPELCCHNLCPSQVSHDALAGDTSFWLSLGAYKASCMKACA